MIHKYRAYNKANNKMIDPVNVFPTPEQTKNGDYFPFRFEKGTGGLDFLVLLQWTGLLDFKGKEIFDRDILKLRYNNEIIICKVEWDDKQAAFVFTDGNKRCDVRNMKFFEVIGNMFEDSKLMPKKEEDKCNTCKK